MQIYTRLKYFQQYLTHNSAARMILVLLLTILKYYPLQAETIRTVINLEKTVILTLLIYYCHCLLMFTFVYSFLWKKFTIMLGLGITILF